MGSVVSRGSALLLMLEIGASLAGCAKLRARAEPDRAALDVPPPPARMVASQAPTELPSTSLEWTTEEQLPAIPQPRRFAPPPANSKENAPATAAPAESIGRDTPIEVIGPEPPEPRPVPSLQAGNSGPLSAEAIREQLARASALLSQVNYRTLSRNLKEQYEVAKRFIQQSEDALKVVNLLYASTLAGKATEIAELLPK